MARYNRSFDLSLGDMDLIETALRRKKRALSQARLDGDQAPEVEETLRDIHALLGRLHNQKQFFRPKTGVYVSG